MRSLENNKKVCIIIGDKKRESKKAAADIVRKSAQNTVKRLVQTNKSHVICDNKYSNVLCFVKREEVDEVGRVE